jgi:FMN hydrolase / 5-amino-6-(5-phospho-D-ribitylamino)uracil phosphatase
MSRDRGLRLIVVDLDDTLWPCAPVIRQAEEALWAWLAPRAPRLRATQDLASLRAHRIAFARANPGVAHDITALRKAALAEALRESGDDPVLAEPAVEVFVTARQRVEPYPEVAEVLARWRDRYLLVAVSNGNADVERTPLRGLFHHALDAAAVGAMRPDPALFRAAIERTGVEPAAALHVGDDPVNDVAAARAFGLRTAWVNRSGRIFPADLPPAEVEVPDLGALAVWLTG